MSNQSAPSQPATKSSAGTQPATNLPTSTRQLTLPAPHLILPTIACFLTTALLYALTYYSFYLRFLPLTLRDILTALLTPLVPALSLFLLHRLLELIILHRTFLPAHLLSVAAILLSIAVFTLTGAIYLWIILYALAGVIFAASLSFQKSHSLAANPAHFRSSLLSAATVSFILSLLTILILVLFSSNPSSDLTAIILFSLVVIVTIPLQLTLTFLCLTKLTPARTAHLLSRFHLIILGATFLLAIISTTAYLAVSEHLLAQDYVHRQPCCYQPVTYDHI